MTPLRQTRTARVFGPLPRLESESGQTLAEYALIFALVVVLAVAAVTLFGGQVQDLFSTIGSGVKSWMP